jgi:hypothetical protein
MMMKLSVVDELYFIQPLVIAAVILLYPFINDNKCLLTG